MSSKSKKQAPEILSPVLPAPPVNEFVERDESLEQKAEIDYDALIHIHQKERPLDPEEAEMSQKIVFYCKDCQKICEAAKQEKRNLKFCCKDCGGENIYYGSELGIRNYFHLSR